MILYPRTRQSCLAVSFSSLLVREFLLRQARPDDVELEKLSKVVGLIFDSFLQLYIAVRLEARAYSDDAALIISVDKTEPITLRLPRGIDLDRYRTSTVRLGDRSVKFKKSHSRTGQGGVFWGRSAEGGDTHSPQNHIGTGERVK